MAAEPDWSPDWRLKSTHSLGWRQLEIGMGPEGTTTRVRGTPPRTREHQAHILNGDCPVKELAEEELLLVETQIHSDLEIMAYHGREEL